MVLLIYYLSLFRKWQPIYFDIMVIIYSVNIIYVHQYTYWNNYGMYFK